MRFDKIYTKLKKKYSDEEIADAMIIPSDVSEDEKKSTQSEINKIRQERLSSISDKDQILSDVMRLRFQIEEYVMSEVFSFNKTFGKFLEEYIHVVKKSRQEIAKDISLHYTKLSRIINDKEEPSVELCYRLEKYSGSLISAVLWWKLIKKKEEFIISQDIEPKKKEQKKVKNYLETI